MTTFEWDYEHMIKQIFSNSPWSDRYVIKSHQTEWKIEIYKWENGVLVDYERHKEFLGGAECWSWKPDGTLWKHYLKDFDGRVIGEYENFIKNEHGYISHDYGNWTEHDKTYYGKDIENFKYPRFNNWR